MSHEDENTEHPIKAQESSDFQQIENNLEGNILLSDFFENAETILDQLKTATLAAILFKNEQDIDISSVYEKSIFNNYKNRMGFYITCLFNKQFDIFTPPKKEFLDNYSVKLFFEFYEPQFKIIAKIDSGLSTINFGYELNALPILECLETGNVSRELFSMLEKMKFRDWDNGILITKCTDFRLEPYKEFLIKLTASSELIDHFYNILDPTINMKEKLEFEKRALLLQNPKICTDPSQDVARIYSDVDWRKKIWVNHENITKDIMTRKSTRVHIKKSNAPKIDSEHKPDIESYQNIFDSIFQEYQV